MQGLIMAAHLYASQCQQQARGCQHVSLLQQTTQRPYNTSLRSGVYASDFALQIEGREAKPFAG